MKTIWYGKKTSGDQGLVIDEETGRNVAVTYDEKDVNLVAAAPELLEALEWALDYIERNKEYQPGTIADIKYNKACAVIAKAKGE